MRSRLLATLAAAVALGAPAKAEANEVTVGAGSADAKEATPPPPITLPPATVWQGTASGDISGDLTTKLLALRVTGPVWQVEFDFTVEAGSSSFTTRLSGILNTDTGAVAMNGTVSQGYLLGARVHEEGQLVDPATLRFIGSIQIMPATAG